MSFLQRYAEKFTSLDGTVSYTFPLRAYEYEPEQALKPSLAGVVGADYAHDFLGANRWVKDVGSESIRFEVVGSATPAALDTEIDSLVSKLVSIGLGKLYTIDSAGSRRWCYAKLDARPGVQVRIGEWMRQPVSLHFVRLSDWFDTTATTGTVSVTTSPKTFTINNPGNARVRAITFRLRSNNATGFTNPSLSNGTTGQSIASTRDAASANSELKIVTDTFQVLWSTDDGANYANDYDLVTLGATQAVLMELEPGDNNFTYTDGGTPNFSLEYSFYAAYH